MWRAIAKGAILGALGRVPGGVRAYRESTRRWMGTQATHVDKLARVWPGYVEVWTKRCGLALEGLDVWVHEAGWTPFSPLASYLLTGRAGYATNSDARLLERYFTRAVAGVLGCALPPSLVPIERRVELERLRWHPSLSEAIGSLGGSLFEDVPPDAVPLATASVDLCHSGGALEHYRPVDLRRFLEECFRVLRPGGVASHVFDHRDHLHHADGRLPFLAHLAIPDPIYRAGWGNPLLYHNRLSPPTVAELFESVGFERIAVRRLIYPDKRYTEGGIPSDARPGLPKWLHPAVRRRGFDVADLFTAAAHYLYRKPAEPRSCGSLSR